MSHFNNDCNIISKTPKEGRDKTISDIDCNLKLVANYI